MSVLTCPHRAPREAAIVRIADDMFTEESLRDVRRLVNEPGRHRLHLDLSGVRIPTAGGLGALITLHEELRIRGGRLVLLNVQPWAYEVFSLTRLTEVLDVRAL
jgi:anti-anti-sigma factor